MVIKKEILYPVFLECLKFISIKLRQENFDTIIISSTKMFITWKYIELKLEPNLEQEKS